MEKKYYVVVRTQFDGLHCWKDCPIEEVSFLKTPHRHTFFVTIKIEVNHDDRQVEFIEAKGKIDNYICELFGYDDIKDLGSRSCEMIAEELAIDLINIYGYKIKSIYVSEDGLLDGGIEYEE